MQGCGPRTKISTFGWKRPTTSVKTIFAIRQAGKHVTCAGDLRLRDTFALAQWCREFDFSLAGACFLLATNDAWRRIAKFYLLNDDNSLYLLFHSQFLSGKAGADKLLELELTVSLAQRKIIGFHLRRSENMDSNLVTGAASVGNIRLTGAAPVKFWVATGVLRQGCFRNF